MKILLLTTPWQHEEIAAGFMGKKGGFLKKLISRSGQKILGVTPTLGLLYIAAVLKQAGHKVDVLDGYFVDFHEIVSFIEKEEHKLIGIYSYTVGWENDKRIITLLKDRFPDKIIVAGGPHPTLWKESCLKECDELDIVVCGEGEYIMKELVAALKSGGSLEKIAGIIWRGEEGVKVNSPRPYVEDLNKVPFPDRSLVDLNKYIPTISNYRRLPSATMMASRGCSYSCTFCQATRNVRFRDPENVLDELEKLVSRYGIRDVTFYDDTFTLNREITLKISEGIIERKLNLTWAANARPQGLDEVLLRKMKESGCWRLLFGIESGSQRVLDIMKKGTRIEEIRKIIKLTKRCGIWAYGDFIFGFPGESFEEGLKSIEFAQELDLDYAVFFSFAPLPGTGAYDMLNDPKKNEFARHAMFKLSYIPDSMTKKELKELLTLSYRRFYFRPSYLLKMFFKIRSLEDLRRNIIGYYGLSTLR